MIAGTLEIQLLANMARLSRDMDEAQRTVSGAMNRISSAVSGAMKILAALGAGLAVGLFAKFTREQIDAADEMSKMSQKTGVLVKDIAGLQLAYQQAGNDNASLVTSMAKLSKSMVEGSKSFDLLKISVKTGDQFKTTKDVLYEVADALAVLPDGAQKTALAMDFFGKSGAELIPLLNGGAEGLRAMAVEADSLGLVLNDKTAKDAEKFNDTLDSIGMATKGAARIFAAELLPALVSIATSVREGISSGAIREWAVGAANAVKTLTAAIEPGIKILTAYFAIFYAAPLIYGAASTALTFLNGALVRTALAMLSGQASTIGFNTVLFGTSVAADLASGSLKKMQLAGMVLFAAFAGWQFGTYLHDNFVEARLAGLAFVGAMLTAWEKLKYGAEMAWEGIKYAWDTTINLMKGAFGDYLSTVAVGLKAVGASSVASEVAAYAEGLQKASSSQKTFAEQTASITDAHRKAVDAIDADIVGMMAWELANEKSIKSAKEQVDVKKKSSAELEKERLAQERKAAAAAAAAAAAKKEIEAYNGLIAAIKTKTEENQLALLIDGNLSESQKQLIKIEQQLASGKLVLSAARIASAKAALQEQEATEKLLKTRDAEKATLSWISQSAKVRNAAKDALEQEAIMYGKTNDEKEIALIAIRAEIELQDELNRRKDTGIDVTEEMLAQMRLEKDYRVQILQAISPQLKAYSYAEQLASDNKRFAAESIFDEKQRAAALLEIDAELWRKRIELAGEGTDAQKKLQSEFDIWYGNQSLRPQLEEQRRVWESIDNTAHDTFISIFDSGKSAFDRLRDTLKNGLLDLLYQMTIKKWIFDIAANVSGSASGGSGISSIGSMFETGKTLWQGFSAAGSVGGFIGQMGSLFGSSALSAFGSGMSGTAVGTFAGAGPTIAGSTSGLGALAGTGGTTGVLVEGAGASASAAGAGSSLTTALPIVGWVLAGMAANNSLFDKGWGGQASDGTKHAGIASGMIGGAFENTLQKLFGLSDKSASMWSGSAVVNRLFGHKLPELQQSELSGTFDSKGYAATIRDVYKQQGGLFRGDKWSENKTAVADTSGLTKAFESIKQAAAGYASQLGLSTKVIDDFTRSFTVNLSITGDAAKDAEINQKIISDLLSGMTDEISNLLAPSLKNFSKEGETASATLARLAGSLTGVNNVLNTLGLEKFAATLDGASMAQKLIDATGGIEKFTAGAAYLTENFLSEAEKLKPVSDAVTAALSAIGMGSLKTMEDFKLAIFGGEDSLGNLVAGLNVTTEAGIETYAKLMEIAPQFKLVADYAEKMAQEDLANSAKLLEKEKEKADKLIEINGSVQQQIDTLIQSTMTLTEVRELEKLGQDASTIALLNNRNALQDQVSALEASKLAQEAAAVTAKNHRELDIQLMEALGDAEGALAARRQDSLIGLDEYSQGIMKQIWAANAASVANAAAEKARESAAAEAQRQEQERQSAYQAELQQAKQAYDQKVSASKAALQDAYSAESTVLQELISRMGGFAQAARKLQDSLRYGADSPLSRAQKFAMAQAGLPDVIGAANRGDPEAVEKLAQYVQLLKASASSSEEYAVGVAKVIAILDGSADIAETQETIAKNQLAALKKTVDALLNVDKSVMSVSDAIAQLNIDLQGGLNLVASAAFGQYMANNKSLPTTTTALTPDQIYGGLPGEGDNQQRFIALLAKNSEDTARVEEYIRAQDESGKMSIEWMNQMWSTENYHKVGRELGLFADPWRDIGSRLPSFDIGTNYVPHDMMAMIHEGEAVIPKAFNPSAFGPVNSGSSQVSDLVERLMKEVDGLRAEAKATAIHTENISRLFRRVTPQGDAIATREVVDA